MLLYKIYSSYKIDSINKNTRWPFLKTVVTRNHLGKNLFNICSFFSFGLNKQHTFQFSSVAQSCLTLCDPMNLSMPGLPVHHQLPESTQSHVHWVGDAIQPSHPLPSPSPPALNLSQHQGLFQRVSPSHQVAKVLQFQFQYQSFQWTPRKVNLIKSFSYY